MNVELISIGDELLFGKTINTNAAWLGEKLTMIGLQIKKVTTISDSKTAIYDAVSQAMTENSIVIVTGGLGPTNDDITKLVLCDFFNTELELHPEAYKNIEKFVLARKGEMNENNKNQALFPKNAKFIPNPCGTASGMWFEKDNSILISLPGVPFEMVSIMEESIIPLIQEKYTLPKIVHRHILCTGISEAKLAETISSWENQLPTKLKLAYLPSPGIVKLRLTCQEKSNEVANSIIAIEEEKLTKIIEQYIFGYDDDTFEKIIGQLLLKKQASISTAESCTGGNIARSIIQNSGSSAYFKGSIVAYDNSIKTKILQVPNTLIEKHGAVSKEVVESMAKNCRDLFQTNYAIATSGIAGPNGGTVEKPVGTVWIAIATPNKIISQMYNFGDHRERTITRSTIAAFHLLQKNIE